MYSLLIVDDEKFAVKGLSVGIDWSGIGIDTVYEAYDFEEAQDILMNQAVDIAILDIEMPGKSGMELAEWLRDHFPQTEVLFLTGHASFAYAQQAVQLGGLRYMLKPVNYEELRSIMEEAVEKIREDRENLDYRRTYQKYFTLWESQKPLLIERFWQDVVGGRISLAPARLEAALEQYDIGLSSSGKVLPVMISVEKWEAEFNPRDEEIMEYAIRKAAEELVLLEQPGIVIGDKNGGGLILFYLQEGAMLELGEVQHRCRTYIQSCNEYFHCYLSCYVGEPVELPALGEAFGMLQAAERDNVTRTNSVFTASEAPVNADRSLPLPAFDDWGALLEADRRSELAERIDSYIKQMETSDASVETLQAFYYGFAHTIIQTARKRGVAAPDMAAVVDGAFGPGGHPTKSLLHLRQWSSRLIERYFAEAQTGRLMVSSVIAKVMKYVEEHPEQELGREEIAAQVFLNPAYLSRLFRKETGTSLTDYILKVKLERAKRLLSHSGEKISSIAEQVGYTHFSYFAKIFKRFTGMSPQEYRKRFRELP
jgi:two-component system, response regulator YesN